MERYFMFLRERLAFSGNALQIRCLVGFDINVIRAVCAARQTIHRNCGKSTDAVKFTTRAGRRLSRSSINSPYSETNSHARGTPPTFRPLLSAQRSRMG